MRLASARQAKADDTTDDDVPSTSGRQFVEATSSDSKVALLWACLPSIYFHLSIVQVSFPLI